MTIFALWLINPECAVACTDTELFGDGSTSPAAYSPKLMCNSFISAIAGGTGLLAIMQAADLAFHRATDFDALPDAISAALRKAAAAHAGYFDREPRKFLCQNYAVAGWSYSAGRMLAWSFSAGNYFAPLLAGTFAVPEIERGECWRPGAGADVLTFAREQAAKLRQRLPGAGTGALTIATVQRGHIELQTIADFDAEARAEIDRENTAC